MELWIVIYVRPDEFLNLYGVFSTKEKAKRAVDKLLSVNPSYKVNITPRKLDQRCFNPVVTGHVGERNAKDTNQNQKNS